MVNLDFTVTVKDQPCCLYLCRKKSDRLEWMYSAPGHSGVNHEDYLLGKAIDKAVDPLAANDEKVPTFIIWSTIQPYYFIYLFIKLCQHKSTYKHDITTAEHVHH